jgi:NRAMP (natural resistance-associated macrophage protein)-like metal ion transporter
MKRYLKPFILFLSVLGPSVITTMAGNDGGGVITYSFAGAKLGFSILLILPVLTILYGITQEMGSRIAIATGKGLGDIIREQFGVKIALVVFILLLVANFGSVLTNVAAVKTASIMLGIAPMPFIVVTIFVSFLLITKFSYEKSQRLFLSGIVFYFAYVFSAIKANPHWMDAFKSMLVPTSQIFSSDYIIIAIAVLGTTITPWGQFFVQSYMKDKNISVDRIGFAKIEAYTGAFVSNIFTFFIIVATAATLFVNKIPLISGEQAAMAIRPFAGELSGILFGVGLVNAAIIGMVIVSLSSAYAFTEFFGFEGSLDAPYHKGKMFYIIFLSTLIVAGLLVLTPWISLFKIVLYTQSLNAILLPVFFYFLLKITNNKELMGKHTNGKVYNIFAITASVAIVLASISAVIISLTQRLG